MDASWVSKRGHGSHGVFSRILWMLTLMALLCATVGCGTLSNGRGWGQDAFSKVRP